MSNSKVLYEGWMVRYGRRKIGRSFLHMRYFVLESGLLAYYKKKPKDNVVPIKTLVIDGNCRVEDRGLKTQHGHMVYVLSVYNKKEKYHRITMAAFNIQEALIWKEKIEQVIDQQQGSQMSNGNRTYISYDYKSGVDNERTSMSDRESQCSAQEDEESRRPTLLRRTTMGNGLPEQVFDWTRDLDSELSNQYNSDQVFSRKHWRLIRCQNGLRIFEELLEVDYLPRSCSRAMKAVGVVEATCEEIFELVMGMDVTRFEQASRKSLTDPISLENIDLTDDWVVEAEDDDAPLLDVDEIDDWMDVADAILDEGEGGAAADEWWRNFGIDDLELQTLAIRILSQTCSSSGCERNWSVFERIHTKRRNRLEHKRLNDLVYTHYNLRLKERWDSSFQYGSLVEEVDGHTAILYHRLQLDWFPMFVWPRDLCYVRYWRRNDDGSYVVLFRSREHVSCGPQPGFVRAHIESGGFNISPLKSRNGRARTQVQHLMQIDLKGWGAGLFPSFQQHCLLQMMNSVAGLREWLSQTDENHAVPRISMMMPSNSASSKKGQKHGEPSIRQSSSLDQMQATNKNSVLLDEYSEEDEEYQIAELEVEDNSVRHETEGKQSVLEEPTDELDLSCFSGNLRRDDRDSSRNCWRISDGNNFRVRSKQFSYDKTKIPAGKPLMELVAVDWFKDVKRMDHVARRQGCAVQVAAQKGLFSLAINLQVPGSTHFSMVFYFVTKQLIPGSLLQRFVDGDDEFRNGRLKLIPSVPKGSWIVRQSVGSTPCLLGKAVDCNYIRGPNYLEIDVDIGSSAVANGVLGLVSGVITTLVVDMAFLVQANSYDELPERLIGAVRASHIELSSAIVPTLDTTPPAK